MTDRPILFSAPMVRALLEGRKTQTRRVIKLAGRLPEYGGPSGCQDDPMCWGWEDSEHGDWVTLEKQLGQRMGWRDWIGAPRTGDRLWVRETYAHVGTTDPGWLVYRATYDDCCRAHGFDLPVPAASEVKWKPSIFMPRRLSRLTLLVTDVRVQRLQDISEADALAEGIYQFPWSDVVPMLEDPADADLHAPNKMFFSAPDDHEENFLRSKAADAFERLWESINGPESWAENPWVAAITFEVVRANIDQVKP